MHVGPGITIRYASDESRQKHSVEYELPERFHRARRVRRGGIQAAQNLNNLTTRVMDCVDCQLNRPAHTFQLA